MAGKVTAGLAESNGSLPLGRTLKMDTPMVLIHSRMRIHTLGCFSRYCNF